MRTPAALILLLLLSASTLGADDLFPAPVPEAAPVTYPDIALQARLQGDVKIEFSLNSDGETMSVSCLSGFPLLNDAALRNVQAWKFRLPQAALQAGRTYVTTFTFRIPEGGSAREGERQGFVDGYRHVVVVGNPPGVEHCPSPDQAEPPSVVDGEHDFVQLSRSGCYGTCPVYSVTVSADGQVSWHGDSFVAATGERQSRIGQSEARSLMEPFRSPAFWALCESYSTLVTDSATVETKVRFGERSKTVSNYANSAPPWLKTLEQSIDEAANTHAWRHGNPSTEPLANIARDDGFLPKPGVTALMRASARGDTDAIRGALDSGGDVESTDSSGWTALMYAAAGPSASADLLLAAGADVNHRSPHGDTPLMASATAGTFNETLIDAGADIDAQNKDGVSVLMILSAKGRADQVQKALNGGANPLLKDHAGRVAFDYLRLANCGKSPIGEPFAFATDREGKCDYLDPGDVRRIAGSLKAAERKGRR